ncbi:6885_t:CDS:2 [Ambispora gerdemannii]|uniref:Thioredoxin-dependent peroxiredoxin n=1 Tax=Ambispora gerdemannii TaxID=144530 RepID=A0A9N9BV24_9GLOM|nr:6885_t:CDS:2 [Ambispora gerdemannii]
MKASDKLPSVTVNEKKPTDNINIADFFAPYKKAILFGVPGAFTPGCAKTHVPGYLENYDKIKAKGVEKIAVISVNDAYVMQAWRNSYNHGDKITFLADPRAEFAKAADLYFDVSDLGGIRSKRFAAILENGVVTRIDVESDNSGLECSLAPAILRHL